MDACSCERTMLSSHIALSIYINSRHFVLDFIIKLIPAQLATGIFAGENHCSHTLRSHTRRVLSPIRLFASVLSNLTS
jgi:hypothetical protein